MAATSSDAHRPQLPPWLTGPGEPEESSSIAATTKKPFASALLADTERDDLHAEVYAYFRWLEKSLAAAGRSDDNDDTSVGLAAVARAVAEALEAGLRSVREGAPLLSGYVDFLVANGEAPFLERRCRNKSRMGVGMDGEAGRAFHPHRFTLPDAMVAAAATTTAAAETAAEAAAVTMTTKAIVESEAAAAAVAPTTTATKTTTTAKRKRTSKKSHSRRSYNPKYLMKEPSQAKVYSRPLWDFDTEFDNLAQHKAEHGNCSPPKSSRVGRWVSLLRTKRAQMEANDDSGDNEAKNGIHEAGTSSDNVKMITAPPGRLGIAVQVVDDEEREGVLVTMVTEYCPFGKEVRKGDRIVSIDDIVVTETDDLKVNSDKTRIIGIVSCEQQEARRRGRRPLELAPEQIERLDSLGFNWENKPKRLIRSWEDSFQDLLAYYKTHGNLRVPRSYKPPESEFGLGEWVHQHRRKYRIKDPYFMKNYASKLDAIGFEWNPRKSDFETKFKELVEYKRIHGTANVPNNHNRKNPYVKLARWGATLRASRKREESRGDDAASEEKSRPQHGGQRGSGMVYLTKERIELLDSLGFDWDFGLKSFKEKTSPANSYLEELAGGEGEFQVEEYS